MSAIFVKERKNFPILSKKIKGKTLVYLDNAATTQKPKQMIDALTKYYKEENANVHRSSHTLSQLATEKYESTRNLFAEFIGASKEEIIFTSGTTDGFNKLCRSFDNIFSSGEEVFVTESEHHSVIVPVQEMCKRNNLKLKYIKLHRDASLDVELFEKSLTSKTKLVFVSHISNVLGLVNNISRISDICHKRGILLCVDAAQSAGHLKLDVKKLDCDFLLCSAHKMYGPTGLGMLYVRKELLSTLKTSVFGGGMIKEVTLEDSTYIDGPNKFEAGTPNIADVIAFGATLNYLNKISMKKIEEYEKELAFHLFKKLKEIKEITIYGFGANLDRIPLISFNIRGFHSEDVAYFLDKERIEIRSGHHCAMPLMKVLGTNGTARISLSFYNTKEEIDKAIEMLKKLVSMNKEL